MPQITSSNTLLEEGLKFLNGAHHQGAAQADANEATSTLPALKHALSLIAAQRVTQAKRLEKVFKSVGLSPSRSDDMAMQGILDMNQQLIASTSDPEQRDLINIAAAQLAAHFYLATYGTLRNYARVLGNKKAVKLLGQTIDESSEIDSRLTHLSNVVLSGSNKSTAATSDSGSGLRKGLLFGSLILLGLVFKTSTTESQPA